MRTRAKKYQNQLLVIFRIDQQPIGRDMTLAIPSVVASEWMVLVLVRQNLPFGEHVHNVLKQRELKSSTFA